MSIFGVSEEKNRWLKERWKPLMGRGNYWGVFRNVRRKFSDLDMQESNGETV
jgi:hypothetical protein